MWNVAAEPVEPWELELLGESGRYDRSTKGSGDGLRNRLRYFPDEELDLAQFPWVCETTPEHQAALLATTSMAIAMSEHQRASHLAEARSKLQAACDTAGRASMPLRFEASCARWTPRP